MSEFSWMWSWQRFTYIGPEQLPVRSWCGPAPPAEWCWCMTDYTDVRAVACAGQTALVCRYGPLSPGTGPVTEQTGSGPGNSPTRTGTTQYQMDPSVRERVCVAEWCLVILRIHRKGKENRRMSLFFTVHRKDVTSPVYQGFVSNSFFALFSIFSTAHSIHVIYMWPFFF